MSRTASTDATPLVGWRERAVATYRALRDRPRTRLEWAYLILWIFYLFSYPFAVIGVAFNVRAHFSMAWAGSVLLFVQGALAVLWLMQSLGTRHGGEAAFLVAVGAFAVETFGVATGFPFGHYDYTHILFPRLPGSVPLPVIGAWLLVVASSVGIARRLEPGDDKALSRQISLAMVLGAALDFTLEPVAVKIEHYWVWHTTGIYYGIPGSNFLAWYVVCGVLAGVVIREWNRAQPQGMESRRQQETIPATARIWIPSLAGSMVWLYALTMAMFAFIDLTHGLWIAALFGPLFVAFACFVSPIFACIRTVAQRMMKG